MPNKMQWKAYRLAGGERSMIEVTQLNHRGNLRKVVNDVSLGIEPRELTVVLEDMAASLAWLLTLSRDKK